MSIPLGPSARTHGEARPETLLASTSATTRTRRPRYASAGSFREIVPNAFGAAVPELSCAAAPLELVGSPVAFETYCAAAEPPAVHAGCCAVDFWSVRARKIARAVATRFSLTAPRLS